MVAAASDVRCPRCGGGDLYRFGKDPLSGFQRYRCRNPSCRRQFIPEKPSRPRKYPKMICPKCGAGMSIFKVLSDALRFRCNRYRARGEKRCTHKINVPLPGRESFDTVTDPRHVRLLQGQILTAFHWNRMKFSPTTAALALYFSFFRAQPAPAVVATLRDLYQLQVSHDTITRWSHKAAFLLSEKCTQLLQIPKKKGRKPRLFLDETQRKVRGHKRWFWMAYCRRHDLVLGRNLSARRNTQAARDTLAMTYRLAPEWKKSDLLTDGLWSYVSALGDLDVSPEKHLVYKSFFEQPNNNALERKWSNFHVRARPFRGFKSDLGQMAFIEAQIVYHNAFKPSPHLGGLTPYQHLGIRLPDAPNDWMRLSRLLTS
jgi:transposase-like protein